MAGPERTADSFAVPLCLWQRAAFLSPPPGSVASDGGGGERDSLRLRIAQLKHEHWNRLVVFVLCVCVCVCLESIYSFVMQYIKRCPPTARRQADTLSNGQLLLCNGLH